MTGTRLALHRLAVLLGKTVAELSEILTLQEFNDWCFYSAMDARAEKEPPPLTPDDLLRAFPDGD